MTLLAEPFCPAPGCRAFMPEGIECRHCGHVRLQIEAPRQPGTAIWRARVEAGGRIGGAMTLAVLGAERVLLVPWSRFAGPGELVDNTGGVLAVDATTGREKWKWKLGMPVEGGVAVGMLDGAPIVIVAGGERGLGTAGQGWVRAVWLESGQPVPGGLDRRLGGTVRCAPALDDVRVFVGAGSGHLYCVDIRDGTSVSPFPIQLAPEPRPMPASPLVLRGSGLPFMVLAATYAHGHRRSTGRLTAVDERGAILWSHDSGGSIRAAPAVAGRIAYVAAYRSAPSAGLLTAVDVQTGRCVWPRAFEEPPPTNRIPAGPSRFVASPLVQDGVVFVPSLSGAMYAIDCASGHEAWRLEHDGAALATAPLAVEGLLVYGGTDGKVRAYDIAARREWWVHDVGSPVRTNPIACQGQVIVGCDDGWVCSLPWHGGRFRDLAERLAARGHPLAGDAYALAMTYEDCTVDQEAEWRDLAVACWSQARRPQRVARLWSFLGEEIKAAEAWRCGGRALAARNRSAAADCYAQALASLLELRRWDSVNECARRLADCVRGPSLTAELANSGLRQGVKSELTLRLVNQGYEAAGPGVVVQFSGSFVNAVPPVCTPRAIPVQQSLEIPLEIMPVREQASIRVVLAWDWTTVGGRSYHLSHVLTCELAVGSAPLEFPELLETLTVVLPSDDRRATVELLRET